MLAVSSITIQAQRNFQPDNNNRACATPQRPRACPFKLLRPTCDTRERMLLISEIERLPDSYDHLAQFIRGTMVPPRNRVLAAALQP
jgi:hypothetical protein